MILVPAQRSNISQDREPHAFWDGKRASVLVDALCDGSCRTVMARAEL
ncbi:hypothetical protein HMPREF0281_00794 [Corynebacterium ammoniagenes DSM 20306]|uniref:Uncharacterized protein n=1 Tax=Corynebacterium ammoniagenes DSM 20306 TaxID=649754 RepID=A0ABN0AGX3_CORAM|nr:hypothetical protein HMPREF0281_00794 [Corynebacterium ammoniagenes DSM 20306]